MALQGGVSNLSDSIIRQVQYVVDTKGMQGLADLQTQLGRVNASIAISTAQYAAGQITLAQYEKGMLSLVDAQRNLEGQVKLATAAMANGGAVTDKLVDSLRRKERALQGSSYAWIQVAYAMDDVQYGASALVNNIASLSMAIGPQGMAGQIAVGVTGAYLFVKAMQNAEAITKAVNSVVLVGINVTKDHAEEMAELGKKTSRTNQETERYVALKKEQKDIEEALAVQGNEPKSQKEAVQAALAEAGGGEKVAGQLAGVLGSTTNLGRDHAAEDELRKEIEAFNGRAPFGTNTPEDEKRINELRDAAAEARARNLGKIAASMIAKAQTDPGYLESVTKAVQQNKGAFGPELGRMLEQSTPQAIRENKERDEDIKADEAKNKKLSDATAARRKATAEMIAKESIPGIGMLDSKAINAEIGPIHAAEVAQKKEDAGHKRLVAEASRNIKPGMMKSVQDMVRRQVSYDRIVARLERELANVEVDPLVATEVAESMVQEAIRRHNSQVGGRNLRRREPVVPAGRRAAPEIPGGRRGVDPALPRAPLPDIKTPELKIQPGSLQDDKSQAMLGEIRDGIKRMIRGIDKMGDGAPAVLA